VGSTQRHLDSDAPPRPTVAAGGADLPVRMRGGLLGELAVARRLRGLRRLGALAVIGVLALAAVPLVHRQTAAGGAAEAAPGMSPGGPAQLRGERHGAVDPHTGVSGWVGLENRPWGTAVGLELSNLPGPLRCVLVAVSTQGERAGVTSWNVPAPGYGVPGQPQPLIVQGGAAIAPPDLDHFEVDTLDGARLLSIPARS
jgi:hypothetical protein